MQLPLAAAAAIIVMTSHALGKEAYVTLFYSEDPGFLLAVRVLGQSLREAYTTRDMVVLTLPGVSQETKQLLRSDGWKVIVIDPDEIPYEGPYKGHVAKLRALTLTQYDKVALLDSDVIAFPGCDDIFGCGNYCAVTRHSNLFNSGVMVVTPNIAHFTSILEMLKTWDPMTHPHSGGDQDILNAFYPQIPRSAVYDRSLPVAVPPPVFAQLPYEYNLDAGIYYLRSRFLVEQANFRFLHFTFGPVRPWQWFSYLMFDLNWQWTEIRNRLPATSPGIFDVLDEYKLVFAAIFVTILRISFPINQIHLFNLFEPMLIRMGFLCAQFIANYKLVMVLEMVFAGFISVKSFPDYCQVLIGVFIWIFMFIFYTYHLFEFNYFVCLTHTSGSPGNTKFSLKTVRHYVKMVSVGIGYPLFCLLIIVNLRKLSSRIKASLILVVPLLFHINGCLEAMMSHWTGRERKGAGVNEIRSAAPHKERIIALLDNV